MNREMPLCPTDVRCHGVDAWSNLGHRVKSLGTIDRDQAADLLGIPTALRSHEYMWCNKGWIVEGRAYRVRDQKIGDGPLHGYIDNGVSVGERLIYLADGAYYRLEVVS